MQLLDRAPSLGHHRRPAIKRCRSAFEKGANEFGAHDRAPGTHAVNLRTKKSILASAALAGLDADVDHRRRDTIDGRADGARIAVEQSIVFDKCRSGNGRGLSGKESIVQNRLQRRLTTALVFRMDFHGIKVMTHTRQVGLIKMRI